MALTRWQLFVQPSDVKVHAVNFNFVCIPVGCKRLFDNSRNGRYQWKGSGHKNQGWGNSDDERYSNQWESLVVARRMLSNVGNLVANKRAGTYRATQVRRNGKITRRAVVSELVPVMDNGKQSRSIREKGRANRTVWMDR